MGDARVLSRAAGGGGGVGCRSSGISLTHGVDFFDAATRARQSLVKFHSRPLGGHNIVMQRGGCTSGQYVYTYGWQD